MEWNVSNTFKSIKEMETKTMMDMALIPSIDPIDIGLGSLEKGNNTVTVVKPRKKSMTSLYLKFFETDSDGKSRSCKFCKQRYSIATATGNLGRHLNNRHPGYDRQQGDPATQAMQAVQITQPISATPNKPQPQVKSVLADFDHLNWLLLKWVIGSSLPFSTFEDEGLLNCFRILNSSVKFWARERFQTFILEVFRSMREDVKASLGQVTSGISITLDFWTSYEQVCYMSVTGHWIDENWTLHKVLLDISHIPCSHGGVEIYHTLLKVRKIYNIDKDILSCTHDNSQGAIHACHLLKENLDARDDRKFHFYYIPCAARTLSLIIGDGLKMAKSVISKIREFVHEMNASLEIAQEFRQIAAVYKEGSWKIPSDMSTRWSGEYSILDFARKAYTAIEVVIKKHDTLVTQNMLLSPPEKNAMNTMHSFLEPFYKTTNNLCISKSPTIGLVLFFMDHIIETIGACKDSRNSPEWLKNIAEDMAKKARSYSSDVHKLCTYMAAVLDPRIKGELLPENLNTESNLEEARNHFMRIYSYATMANGCSSVHASEEASGVSFAEEIARKRRRVGMGTATDELTQYLSEPPAPLTMDVLDWWKANGARYPRLSSMARDYLAVQATSVGPNELFSSKGDDVEKQRICLPGSDVQPILCIRSWSRSGYKFKFRSVDIDYEQLIESTAAVAVPEKY